jgi:hypothetical protein
MADQWRLLVEVEEKVRGRGLAALREEEERG